MDRRTLFIFAFGILSSTFVIAASFSKSPQGIGGCPSGYSGLGRDWCVAEEFDGTISANSWVVDDFTGQEKQEILNQPWSTWSAAHGGNGTPTTHSIYARSEGTVRVKFKWRGTGTPPSTLRLKVWSDGYVASYRYGLNAATAPDFWSLETGLGLPVVDGGNLLNWKRETPGKVLRKVKIDETGFGQFEVDQCANIELAATGTFTITASLPDIGYEIDSRDVTITTPVYGNPLRKKVLNQFNQHIVLPQDFFTYYSSSSHDPYWGNRIFQYTKAESEASPITFPSDASDYSEWHIGLQQDTREVDQYIDAQIIMYEVLGFLGIVSPYAVGDLYEWTWSIGHPLSDLGDYPVSGEYDGNNLEQITARGRRYERPSLYVQWPNLPQVRLDQYPGHTNSIGTATFRWTWADGLVGESVRNVVLHRNAEPDGQESATWWDLRVGAPYVAPPVVTFTPPPGADPVAGWVTMTAQSCDLFEYKEGRIKFDTLDSGTQAIISASFALMLLAQLEPTPMAEAIIAGLASGALALTSVGWDDEEPKITVQVTRYADGQCDTLEVRPPLNLQTYGNTSIADYSEPAKLQALKDELESGNVGNYYWKVDLRRKYYVKKFVSDRWGQSGYIAQSVDTKYKPFPMGAGYFRFTFDMLAGEGGSL